jgi:lactate dehydrogenase-like 2-hydroxyacid dehydrogenase
MKKPSKIVFLDAITIGEVDNLAAISAQAIDKNRLAVTALDVLTAEPIKVDNPLFKVRNSYKLFITRHFAGSSREARRGLISRTAENIASYFGK